MERSEIRDDSKHVIDITNKPSPSTIVSDPSTTNGTHARKTPFAMNSGYLITFELVITMSQIIAAIVVLSISKHERPRVPLFTWVIGYACGCVATLPLLFWRFYHRNDSAPNNTTGTTMAVRLKVFEMVLDCFFLAWLVFGSVCIFARGSVSDAPNLYSLLIVFQFCISIRFGMPLCLQCINSILGFRKLNRGNNRGPQESTSEGGVVAAGIKNELVKS
ncbi:hypothetical protein L1887_29826 [Cichorium endivia]|nr:hypothetical protein L1887_29826 [Cichorium endivia]